MANRRSEGGILHETLKIYHPVVLCGVFANAKIGKVHLFIHPWLQICVFFILIYIYIYIYLAKCLIDFIQFFNAFKFNLIFQEHKITEKDDACAYISTK